MTVNTWADSYGMFHVRVPRNAASPVIAARRALRDELLARDSNVDRSVWMHPVRVQSLDNEETIVYCEGSTVAPAVEESAYTRFNALLDKLSGHARDEADRLCSQAVSYVWGFQDAGGEVKDTNRSTEFGYAYGIVRAKCALSMISSAPPIQDAWKSWQEFGEIRSWDGKRLDG